MQLVRLPNGQLVPISATDLATINASQLIQFSDGHVIDPELSINTVRYHELMQHAGEFGRYVDLSGMSQFADSADASAFLIGQLAYLENTVFQVQTVPVKYDKLLPVDSSAGGAVETYDYQIMDAAGVGRDTSTMSNDIQEVNVAYGKVSMGIATYAVKYTYSTQELRASAFLRRPITEAKARLAYQAEQKFIENIAMVGSSAKGFYGLLNNPNVPVASTTASGQKIGSGTTTQAISDICAGIYSIYVNSAYNDLPNVIGLPPSIFNYLSQTFPGTTALQSLLEWIRANNYAKAEADIDIKFTSIPQLETAGSGGSRRMVFYVKDWDRVRYIYPMPQRFLAPQFRDLKVHIPAETRYSGTAIYYPQSAYYIDNA